MAFFLGLTGNIACGKSTVGRLLAARPEVDYIDADAVVHELYQPGTPTVAEIANRFGAQLLQADGTIDRRKLGDLVMADPAARVDLEAILIPRVRALIEQRLVSSTRAVVVLDAIKLIESGYVPRCDAVWVVTCDREDQLRRLQESRGLSAAQAALRIDAQGPQEEKVRYATVVLHNTGSLDDLARQVEAAWEQTVAARLGG